MENKKMIDVLLGNYGSKKRTIMANAVTATINSNDNFNRVLRVSILRKYMAEQSSNEKALFTLGKMGLSQYVVPNIYVQNDWYTPLHKVLGDVTLGDIVLPAPRMLISMTIGKNEYTGLVSQESPESEVVIENFTYFNPQSSEVVPSHANVDMHGEATKEFVRYFCYAMIASEVNLAEKRDTPRGAIGVSGSPVCGYDYKIVAIKRSRGGHTEGTGNGSKKRFHFRRAHKRILGDGREIRIGWMFVGDIELGFVDKDYEL